MNKHLSYALPQSHVAWGAQSGEGGPPQGSPCSWEEAGSFLLLLKLRVWDFNPNNIIPRFLFCQSYRGKC